MMCYWMLTDWINGGRMVFLCIGRQRAQDMSRSQICHMPFRDWLPLKYWLPHNESTVIWVSPAHTRRQGRFDQGSAIIILIFWKTRSRSIMTGLFSFLLHISGNASGKFRYQQYQEKVLRPKKLLVWPRNNPNSSTKKKKPCVASNIIIRHHIYAGSSLSEM